MQFTSQYREYWVLAYVHTHPWSKALLKSTCPALAGGGVAQCVGAPSSNWKVGGVGSIPSQGTYLGCGLILGQVHTGDNQSMFLSRSDGSFPLLLFF